MIADEQLRDALEFALAAAQEMERHKMREAVPRPLQPLLKFKRLNRAGLATVRRVVEEDEAFRGALHQGLVAGQEREDGEGADAVAMLWLGRPEGWEDEIAKVLAAEAEQKRVDRLTIEERSASKRLEAADKHVERLRAELADAQAALVSERSRHAAAEQRGDLAERARASVERQLEEARSETRRAKQQAEAAHDETSNQRLAAGGEAASRQHLEAENEGLALRLEEALRARVEAEAIGQHVPRPAQRVDPALAVATEALRDAVKELSDATMLVNAAIAGATAREAERATRQRPARRAQRVPVPIPGGRYGDDAEVVRFLVGVPNIIVIVDGYNVAKTGWPDLELAVQRDRLVEALENLVRRAGTRIRVVFDGAEVVGWTTARRLVNVQFSEAGVIADNTIREVVSALSDEQPIVVVSSDRELVASVRALGANTVGSAPFLVAIR
ncbi:MAG: NYN domain-containing protein [Actinomycetota bacterium]